WCYVHVYICICTYIFTHRSMHTHKCTDIHIYTHTYSVKKISKANTVPRTHLPMGGG
uniref:Uncharacterized protein n=1 Tax=Falco tinnunculus TaxID=100819 RepID=A0A8C4U901_FALTI